LLRPPPNPLPEAKPKPTGHLFLFGLVGGERRNSFETVWKGCGRKLASTGTSPSSLPERKDDEVQRLIRRSRILQVLTFVAVVLISPVSFILGLPFGVSPPDWLATWTHWTVVFITLAFFIAVFGFEGALDSRLRADRISKTPSN
jgi:hypothetical protein